MPDDEGLREEIARVMHASDHGGTWDLLWEELPDGPDVGQRYYYRLADALLPVVERYAALRAAEALREEARVLAAIPRYPLAVAEYLRARAAALDGEP